MLNFPSLSIRKWLHFQWQEQTYKFQYLPFGLSSVPRVFTKVILPIIACLECQGQLMVTVFQALVFLINMEKSLLTPCQKLKFLGITVQSQPLTLYLPYKNQHQNHSTSEQRCLSPARDLAQFIGTTNAAAVAIPPAPLFYRKQNTSFRIRQRAWKTQQRRAEVVERTNQSMECPQL